MVIYFIGLGRTLRTGIGNPLGSMCRNFHVIRCRTAPVSRSRNPTVSNMGTLTISRCNNSPIRSRNPLVSRCLPSVNVGILLSVM